MSRHPSGSSEQSASHEPEATCDTETLPPLLLAVRFHETYERLAPGFGYTTRPETRVFDSHSPNGRLMVAVCGELLDFIAKHSRASASGELPPTTTSAPSDSGKDEPVAWLLTGGGLCKDRVTMSLAEAERAVVDRWDGTQIVALYTKAGEPR